jgi:hypothetical protein
MMQEQCRRFIRNFSLSCGDGILLPLVDQFS